MMMMMMMMMITSLEDMVFDFRERGIEGERNICERETLISCLPYAPQPGIEHTT